MLGVCSLCCELAVLVLESFARGVTARMGEAC